MAEPRRSVRSTKGVNNRLSDIGTETTPPAPNMPAAGKSKKKAAGAKGRFSPPPPPSDDESQDGNDGSDDIIRCVCGATEEDEDDNRMMIQCEGCQAWQHTICMGVVKKKIPKVFLCEVCKPEDHQLLLEQIGRGEKPWERRPGRKPKARKGVAPAKNQKKEATSTIPKGGATPSAPKKEPIPDQVKTPTPAAEAKVAPKKGSKRKKSEIRNEPDPVIDPLLEDGMDVDEPIIVTDVQTKQQPPVVEPGEETDRERTLSMELSPAKEAEILSAKKPVGPPVPVPMPVESQPDHRVGFVKSPVLPKPDDPHLQSPISKTKDARNKTDSRRDSVISVKRKAADDSDGEYKEDEDKQLEKRARRGSQITAPAPVGDVAPKAPERRRPSVPKPAKKQKQEDSSPQKELVQSIDQLRSEGRRKLVAYLVTSLQDLAAKLVNEHDLHLEKDQSAEQLCERLCLQVEHHVYLIFFKEGELSSEYRKKLTSIAYNLRANNLLSTELLRDGVSPERLANMTSDEMASKELKEFAQQVRWQSEKHHTLITETGPRIRRTHKGEELVGELKEASANGQETLLSDPVIPRAEQHVEDPSVSAAMVRSPTEDVGDPMAITGDQGEFYTHDGPAPIDTRDVDKPQQQFNLESVWDHVESTDTEKAVARSHGLNHGQVSIRAASDSKIDKDIDMLLKEDDGTGTPPYSPAMSDDHYSPAPIQEESLWRGCIEMNGIASLPATASLIGGPEYIGSAKWFELLADVLQVDGRIKHDRATEYLCGQKFSKTSSLIMASLTPVDQHADVEFHKLFDYFKRKDRYAVVGRHTMQFIKDLYIVPVDVDDNLPDWFNVLDPPPTVVQEGRESKLLVVIFVVMRGLVGPPAAATPTTSESQYPQPQGHHLESSSYTPLMTHASQGQFQQAVPYAQQVPQHQQQHQPYVYPNAGGSLPEQQQHYGGSYQAASYPHNGQSNVSPQGNSSPSSVPAPAPTSTPGASALELEEPLLTMTRDLIQMIPDLPLEQVLVINKMLKENPEMQTDSEEIVKLVGRHLGGGGGGTVYPS